MNFNWITLVAAGLLASPALADGDAAAGERIFNQCQACHVVADADGNVLAGRSGKTGPNLFGLDGRAAASIDGFRYGNSIKAAAEKGLVWDDDTFVEYVQDPTAFLREYNDDARARSNMSFRLRKEDDAENVFAYINSLTPGM